MTEAPPPAPRAEFRRAVVDIAPAMVAAAPIGLLYGALATAKGLSWTSPRGPLTIDALTRDVVQTVYIRKVQRVNGQLQNVEFDKIANVKDPGKE